MVQSLNSGPLLDFQSKLSALKRNQKRSSTAISSQVHPKAVMRHRYAAKLLAVSGEGLIERVARGGFIGTVDPGKVSWPLERVDRKVC